MRPAAHCVRTHGSSSLYDGDISHVTDGQDSSSRDREVKYSRTGEDGGAEVEESETSSSGTSSDESEEEYHSLPSVNVINPVAPPANHSAGEGIVNFRPLIQKPNITKFESSIAQRLPGFLQEMAAANARLQADVEAGKSAEHRFEISSSSESDSESDSDSAEASDDDAHEGDGSDSDKETVKGGSKGKKRQYIEMNLALGVLEEKKETEDIKFREDDSDAESSSDESIKITAPRDIKKATGTKGKKLITEV